MKINELNSFIDGINKIADYLQERAEKKGDIIIEQLDIDYNPDGDEISEEAKKQIPDDLIPFVEKIKGINLEWNLTEFADKYTGLGKIEISSSEIFSNITDNKEYFYTIEDGIIEMSFDDKDQYDHYKFSYLDLFGGPDAYSTIICPKDNLKNYRLGIITSQGSEGFLTDWKLRDYLFNLLKTAGLFYWAVSFKNCKYDYDCLIKNALVNFDYSKENESLLKEILNDIYKLNANIFFN